PTRPVRDRIAWRKGSTTRPETAWNGCDEANGPVKQQGPQGLVSLLGPCYLDAQPQGEAWAPEPTLAPTRGGSRCRLAQPQRPSLTSSSGRSASSRTCSS